MSNVINTRIKVKYDLLSAWNSSTFVPLQGEVCVAVIPHYTNTSDKSVGSPASTTRISTENTNNEGLSGLSPYAVGIKVGDGVNRFSALPWIQAIAGDVYSWAKLPSGGSIPITYNNNSNSTIQQAITGLERSIGGLVSANLAPEALSSALRELTEQLSGSQAEEKFSSNVVTEENEVEVRNYPTKLVRKIVQQGLNVTVEGDNFTIEDLPFQFNQPYAIDNKAATIKDITDRIEAINHGITSVMHFKGEVQTLPEATDEATFNNYEAGDVILYENAEYVYDKRNTKEASQWILLGDEGSYAVKGSIVRNDLSTALQNELDSLVNAIEVIQVNGTPLTIDPNTKSVNVQVPTGALASKDTISSTDLDSSLSQLVNKGIETPNNSGGYTPLTPNATTNNYRLSKIAETGSIYDVEESYGSYLIFDCGTASILI